MSEQHAYADQPEPEPEGDEQTVEDSDPEDPAVDEQTVEDQYRRKAYDRLVAKSVRIHYPDNCLKAPKMVVNIARPGTNQTSTTTAALTWQMERGPIPPGSRVKRDCPSFDCINIDHLYLTEGKASHASPCPKEGCENKREIGDLCAEHWLERKIARQTAREIRNETKYGNGKPCPIPGCGRTILKWGLCTSCLDKRDRGTLRYDPKPTRCIVKGCPNPLRNMTLGLCNTHNKRRLKGQDPAWMPVGPPVCGTDRCGMRSWRAGLCPFHWSEQQLMPHSRPRDKRPYSKRR